MSKPFVAAIVLAALVGAAPLRAGSLDDPSAEALGATLRSLEGRAGTRAPGADPRLGALAESPELYELAGQIFAELTERYHGDPDKMSEAMVRAKNDPEGFAASLSPATRARLKALAATLPAVE